MKLEVGKYLRPFYGERVIGDAVFTSINEDYSYLVVIDGLGHGITAHNISTKIITYIEKSLFPNPSKIIEKIHKNIDRKNGAAIGISVVNHKDSTLTFGGLGNINCKVIGSLDTTFVSSDGVLGMRYHSVQNFKVALFDKDIIVMHSDGVSSTSEMGEFLKSNGYSSRLIAKKIVHTFGSEFDDASCLVVKCKVE